MKIIETDVVDVVVENIDKSKVVLAEKIIKYFNNQLLKKP